MNEYELSATTEGVPHSKEEDEQKMNTTHSRLVSTRPAHSWLRNIHLSYIPGPTTPLLEDVANSLLECFERLGHTIQKKPDNQTDVILTTAEFGKPVRWREALLFTGRARYKFEHLPIVFTLLNTTPDTLEELLDTFQRILAKDPPEPSDYRFPGLAPSAYLTLFEQGRRGGPILALVRLLQSQAMCIRILLVVGEDTPIEAYTFDLVGAHPRSDGADIDVFYEDIAMRIATAASTRELSAHVTVGEPIPAQVWNNLATPYSMRKAGLELGKRNFFTEMVRIDNLVQVPAINDAVARQYSEGCFATWDSDLEALITTVTGSARPVDKGNLTDDELAVIVGVRPDYGGALVRNVEGIRNDPPSSEAVELMDMDSLLPRITLDESWGKRNRVPIVRSKLHGHRGVQCFDPSKVEHVSLDEPYYHYPVSCSTEAQAQAIKAAFSRSQTLDNPTDPRQVVFTVLPGHGVVIAEKWVPGKVPFQVIWEYMDQSVIQIESLVPQGPLNYRLEDGLMKLQEI